MCFAMGTPPWGLHPQLYRCPPNRGNITPVALIQFGQHGARLGALGALVAAKLCYEKPHQQFSLLVSRVIAAADPTPETQQRTLVGWLSVSGIILRWPWTRRTSCRSALAQRCAGGPHGPAAEALAVARHSLGDPTPGPDAGSCSQDERDG